MAIAFAILCFAVIVPSAKALSPSATLNISPESGGYTTDTSVTVSVKITSATDAAAAVDLNITHSANLHYNSADTSGSVFSTQVTAPADSNNTITYQAARTDTGYIGSNGLVISFNFTATSAGAASVVINQSSSAVYAFSDSSNILKSVANGSYSITDATPSPTQTPTTNPTPTSAVNSTTNSNAKPTAKTSTKTSPTPTVSPTVTPTSSPDYLLDSGSPSPTGVSNYSPPSSPLPWWIYLAVVGITACISGIIYLIILDKRRSKS